MIIKSKNLVLLSLGSNLGSPEMVLLKAIRQLEEANILSCLKVSQWYKTEPVGNLDQPWFLNIGISGMTSLSPYALMKICKSIEYLAGRQVRMRWQERELDIDIILYSDNVINLPDITIPHPRMHERRFVLTPLNDIAPDAVHPIFQKTISQLLDECTDQAEVRIYQGGM
ncbi:MAG: 2-amino-4-hydroxy-6-hydroxymethyldihydropteridine diphosphokinase [bacterium]